MKQLALVGVVCGLVFAGAAQAKGPIAATIDGPGTGGGISLGGNGEPGSGAPLGNLADQSGFFAAAFGQTPDPMLAGPPKGDLGPRYTITYRVPGPNGEEDSIRQDLYPYAAGGPVTYTRPQQPFFGTESTRGGWFRASAALKDTLVRAGLPARNAGGTVTPPVRAPSEDEGTGLADLWPAFVVAVVLGLVTVISVLIRRRERTATT